MYIHQNFDMHTRTATEVCVKSLPVLQKDMRLFKEHIVLQLETFDHLYKGVT